jgi:hypothetical protein
MRGAFVGCCTSGTTATANIITATRNDSAAVFFIAHLDYEDIYRALGSCENCNLRLEDDRCSSRLSGIVSSRWLAVISLA